MSLSIQTIVNLRVPTCVYSQREWVGAKLHWSDKMTPDHNSNVQEAEPEVVN